jgi:hypothetical protein
MISVVVRAKDIDAEKAFFIGRLGFLDARYGLGVPGKPAETIEIQPLVAGAGPEISFAADPKWAAWELKKRGLQGKLAGGGAEVHDPDGTIIRFCER